MTTDDAVKIFSEIETYPPLMRAQARAAHVGKDVDWTATFFSGDMEDEQRVFVALRHEASDKMLFAYVRLADHPWLQSTPRGETLRVRGRMANIGPLSIDLESVSLAQVAEASPLGNSSNAHIP